MGIRIRVASDEETTTISQSIGEALLFTTMCIIGLPVEVHVKDGSIYSGIFHTANYVEKDYGIILKKARMVKKGTHDANVANGNVIDTLVVLPGDLVQVVAKGVMLPADGVFSDATSDGAGAGTMSSQNIENETISISVDSHVDKEQMNQTRQIGDGKPQVEGNNSHMSNDSFREELVHAMQGSSISCVDSDKNCDSTNSTEVVLPQHSVSKKGTKDSKLNPGAKIFSPSSVNIRPAVPPVVPGVASVAYVPNNFPWVPITGSQQEVGIRPVAARSSWPFKFVPHASMPAANGGSGSQYFQSVQIAGPIANRAEPIRYVSQHQPIQAGPPYVIPNPQNGMVGRLAPPIYVHPVTHDMDQGAAALSHATYPLLTPQQIAIPKHEGLAAAQPPPLSLTPPLVADGQQPFAIPSHIQLPQLPFPAIRPVSLLGSNGPYSAKFR